MNEPQLGSHHFIPNSPRPSLFRRIFSWRTAGRCLVVFACLITLAALLNVEENWRGKRAWENYKSQAEARGENLDWHQFVPPIVPDDQNFAMTPFLAPLYDLNPLPLKPGQSPWRDESSYHRIVNLVTNLPSLKTNSPAAVLKYLAKYQPVIDELRTASQRPYARFNVSYNDEDPQTILLPHAGVMRRYVLLFQLRASAELALDHSDDAMADINMALYLAGTVKNDPFLISQMVRIALFKAACQPIRQGLADHRWSESQLQQFETRLGGENFLLDFRHALAGERAFFGTTSFDLMRAHRGTYKQTGPGLLPSGWFYFEQVSYHRFIDQKILPGFDPQAERVFPELVDQLNKPLPGDFKSRLRMIWRHEIFASMLFGNSYSWIQKAAFAQSELDQLRIACALERYRLANGTLPESLDALTPRFLSSVPHDVCTGKPLIYHRTSADQFVLYSVGWNLRDDNGKTVTVVKNRIDLSAGDWAWSSDDTNL